MKPTLESFCAKDVWPHNTWLEERRRQTQVYVRRSRRVLNGDWCRTLDIASVTVMPQKQGHFTDFLERAEEQAELGFDALFVENVQNHHLRDFLIKRGYTKAHGYSDVEQDLSPSFYRLTRKEAAESHA